MNLTKWPQIAEDKSLKTHAGTVFVTRDITWKNQHTDKRGGPKPTTTTGVGVGK